MTVENDNLKSIYDLFALCCEQIMEACDKGRFDIPNCDKNDAEYVKIEGLISGYVCNRDQEGTRMALKLLLGDLVRILGLNCTPLQTFKIAKAIDKHVPMEEPVAEDDYSQFVTYSSLNQYLDNKFRIFPILENTFMTKINALPKKMNDSSFPLLRDSKPATSSISNFFKHYIVMNKSNIEEYPIKIVRAKLAGEFCREFSNKNTLKIDLIPFTQVDIEEMCNARFVGDYFWIENMKESQEDRLQRKHKEYFNNTERESADFVIFPEMFFTESLLIHSKEKAKQGEIVVNGSIWKNNRNKCIVTLGKTGLITHYKRCPFVYKKENENKDKEKNNIKCYEEKLVPLDANRKIYQILEIEGFGRIGIGICRDLDYNITQSLWKIIQVNLLIIPAYTNSDDMVNSAQALSNLNNMIIILNNACAAINPVKEECPGNLDMEKSIGFVMFPGIKNGKRHPVVEYYYKKAACVNCVTVCKGHRLIINLNKISTNQESIKTFTWKWE